MTLILSFGHQNSHTQFVWIGNNNNTRKYFHRRTFVIIDIHFRIQHKNKITPYLDRTLRGVVQKTVLAGTEIYSRSTGFIGEPSGELIVNKSGFSLKSKF